MLLALYETSTEEEKIMPLTVNRSLFWKLLSVLLAFVTVTVLTGCGQTSPISNDEHDFSNWPSILEEAQKKAFDIDQNAVIDTVRAMPADDRRGERYNFDFVFLRPSGKELTISSSVSSGLQVIVDSGMQLNIPSDEELQIRRQIISKNIIGPQEALRAGTSLIKQIEQSGSLTLPISPMLLVGSFVEQDYGVQAVWTYDIVNPKERGVVAIDAITGSIIRQETFSR